MKTSLLRPSLFLCLLTLLASLGQGAALRPLDEGLAAYFPFNGNANDESGKGYDLVPRDAMLVADRFGQPNGAYRFSPDSLSSLASTNTFSMKADAPKTFSFWYRYREEEKSPNRWETILAIQDEDPITQDLDVKMETFGLLTLDFSAGGLTGGLYNVGESSTVHLYDDKWHHVVFTIENSALRALFDGTSFTWNYRPGIDFRFSDIHGRLIIGSSLSGFFFNGYIDDVRIYSRAFTMGEMRDLYDQEKVLRLKVPRRAVVSVRVVNGFVVGTRVINGGWGYEETPVIQLVGNGGTGAVLNPVITNGVLERIEIIDPGRNYPDSLSILVAAPHQPPSIELLVTKVKINLRLTLGRKYVLDRSADLTSWTPTGNAFEAMTEAPSFDFEVENEGQYFRVREIPR